MARRLFLLAPFLALLALGFQSAAFSQAAQSAASTQVQGLAPQLVEFAGSQQNFQSLVDGLAGGVPVTLSTLAADGSMQTTTFTPNGTLTAAQIAQTLEAARQQLISRGISAPTAQQIGVTLAGGALPTIAGTVQVTGLVPVTAAATPTAAAGGTRNLSDDTSLRARSDSTLPSRSDSTLPRGIADSPEALVNGVATSPATPFTAGTPNAASPFISTTPATATGRSNTPVNRFGGTAGAR